MQTFYLEITSAVLSVSSVFFDAREKILARPLGLLGVLISFFVYYQANLYARCILSVVYVVFQLYGWYNWLYGGQHNVPLRISKTAPATMIVLLVIGTISTVVLGSILKTYANTDLPYWDSANTIFCLIAKWMLMKKKLENWILWLVSVMYYTCLCFYKGLYLFAFQHFIYIFLDIYGYISWHRSYHNQTNVKPATLSGHGTSN